MDFKKYPKENQENDLILERFVLGLLAIGIVFHSWFLIATAFIICMPSNHIDIVHWNGVEEK